MSTQDRNIHRDAIALRRALSIPLRVPAAGNDQDEPVFALQPRFNYRISDLAVYADVVATALLDIKAQAVPNLAVVGEPQAAAASAITFAVEELWQNDTGILTNVAPDATVDFTTAFTVSDGFWGVVLVMMDGAQAYSTLAQAPVMAFATEALAIANCPRLPVTTKGVVLILTIEADGADFVANTGDTDTANSFNTVPRDGHTARLAVLATPQQVNATLASAIKDASGTNILQGKGGSGGDLLVVSARMPGSAVLTNGIAVVDIRPFPAGGEGRGNVSASQTDSAFVP